MDKIVDMLNLSIIFDCYFGEPIDKNGKMRLLSIIFAQVEKKKLVLEINDWQIKG